MGNPDPQPQLAFLFPGQGSQAPGLLAELAAAWPIVGETFEEASQGAGVDLWAIAGAGGDPRLNQTEFTQPVLLAAAIAVWRVWRQRGGPLPSRLAGHSLGEYSALVAAGVLDLADGARLVRERGRLMQEAVPAGSGAMAAVIGAEDDLVAKVCAQASDGDVVVPANFNAPGQVVIGGHAKAVDRALELLAGQGVRKAVRLPVSVPSHTPLMRQAADRLATVMDSIDWRAPSLPVVHNVDAASHPEPAAIRDALVRQLYLPVRWTECVQALAAAGATRLAECGPGKVLAGLVRRIDRSLDCRPLGTPDDLDRALGDWA